MVILVMLVLCYWYNRNVSVVEGNVRVVVLVMMFLVEIVLDFCVGGGIIAVDCDYCVGVRCWG